MQNRLRGIDSAVRGWKVGGEPLTPGQGIRNKGAAELRKL